MKYLVTGHQVIPGAGHADQVKYLKAGKDWVQKNKENGLLESAYSFADGGGVFIMDTRDHASLMRLLLTFPLSPLTEFSVKPLLEFDENADIIIDMMQPYA